MNFTIHEMDEVVLTDGKYVYLIQDSDNFGKNSYKAKLENGEWEFEDSNCLFCADCLPDNEKEREKELKYIERYNNMTEGERLNEGLLAVGTSLDKVIEYPVSDEELEKLWKLFE